MRIFVSICSCDGVVYVGVYVKYHYRGDGDNDECIFWKWHDGLDVNRLLFVHHVVPPVVVVVAAEMRW